MAYWDGAESYNASVFANGYEWPESGFQFPAFENTDWSVIRLGSDWLKSLTPNLEDADTGYTSLSTILQTLGVDNSTGLISQWTDIQVMIEAAVAAIVADGLSYSGYLENQGAFSNVTRIEFGTSTDFLPLGLKMTSKDLYDLLAGKFDVPAPVGSSKLNITTMQWNLTISGLAYSANSVAYYLSLTVLFAHAALAIAHTAWLLRLQKISEAWESFIDFFALVMNSAPTNELSNTSNGISDPRALKKSVMVREIHPRAAGIGSTTTHSSIQVVVEANSTRPIPQAYIEIQVGRAY